MKENILITGATGFVGINLVKRLLESENTQLYLLVRDIKGVTANARVEKLLKEYYNEDEYKRIEGRFEVISGDVTEENLGLIHSEWDKLAQKINIIFHSAASINFKLPLEEATEINIKGTERILKFAEQCRKYKSLKRVNHISTSYVVGDSKKMFYETELDIGQSFDNTYEITKFETEKLIHKYIDKGVPISIFRPSVISGNYDTGEITKSNLIFVFMRQIFSLRYKEFLCNENSSLNIIPVDYFINALMEISSMDDSIGNTYHIVNDRNTNIKGLVKTCCRIMNVDTPTFVPINQAEKVSTRTRKLLEVFITYIEKSHTFDDTATRKILDRTEIRCPDITDDYIKRITSYCTKQKLL